MDLTFLGTCSGTEPMPGRRHASFVIQHEGRVVWFDAGEGCAYTAHLLGIPLLSVRAIFISHTHVDHVGGLVNLIWTIRKLNGRVRDPVQRLSGQPIRLFIPDLSVWEGAQQVLAGPTFRANFTVDAQRYQDGIIYEDGGLRVIALHNTHLGTPAGANNWQSYSFRIETASKSIVYSGDVADVREVSPFLDSCDLFLMETGHHRVEDICEYLKSSDHQVGQLVFTHHGRAILENPGREAQKARAILGTDVVIAEDGMTLEL